MEGIGPAFHHLGRQAHASRHHQQVVPEVFGQDNLPYIKFHALRHTSISLLIREGVHPKAISSRAGHSNISTTMDIYGHLLKSTDKETANKLESLFQND